MAHQPARSDQRRDTTRLEAFSDGVFAIAITLLVLDLRVPARATLGGRPLLSALGGEWPSLFAYVVSFLIIGILWVNHHTMLGYLDRVNRSFLFTNLVLLLFVAVLPFPTAVVAEYLSDAGTSSHVAAALYGVTMLCVAVAYSVLWLVATTGPDRLARGLTDADVAHSRRRFALGIIVYVVALGLAFVSAVVVLVVHLVVAVYYVFDQLELRSPAPVGVDSGRSPDL